MLCRQPSPDDVQRLRDRVRSHKRAMRRHRAALREAAAELYAAMRALGIEVTEETEGVGKGGSHGQGKAGNREARH